MYVERQAAGNPADTIANGIGKHMTKKTKTIVNLGPLEGRVFILGRDGHIYIDSKTASKHHAEIRIIDGKIRLRDLDSTNGTYLLKNRKLVQFTEGFVNPLQPVVLGSKPYVINDLLKIATEFSAGDRDDTLIETGADAGSKAAGG